ncbi:MAG: cytochrome c [Zoogloeaceae bacterium]|jgi:cytochrome c556|nr:cytochrome c [Zoogloeaceae bacterium]
MPHKKNLLLLVLPIFLVACGEVEDTRPGQPVAHRQQAFKDILRSFEPMGIQLRQDGYEAESFLTHARQLAAVKDAPWAYFGADTQYPPSKTDDALWRETETFTAERDKFLQAVEALLAAAEGRSVEPVRAAYAPVQESCRSCHKRYKH